MSEAALFECTFLVKKFAQIGGNNSERGLQVL